MKIRLFSIKGKKVLTALKTMTEETEVRKANRMAGVNCYIISNISSVTAWLLQGMGFFQNMQ